MPTHTLILYVEDPLKAAVFYEKLLQAKPVEASPGFVVFALHAPTMLGLWKRADVLPKVTVPTGSNELSFQVDSNGVVDQFFESVLMFYKSPRRWILVTRLQCLIQMGIVCGRLLRPDFRRACG
jgi:hypothetical protein